MHTHVLYICTILDELTYHVKDSTASYVYTVDSHVDKVKEVCRDIPTVKVNSGSSNTNNDNNNKRRQLKSLNYTNVVYNAKVKIVHHS